MKRLLPLLLGALLAPPALAYDIARLQGDCQAQPLRLDGDSQTEYDASRQARTERCLAYIDGVIDGYQLGERLANRVGVSLNAFCPPAGEDQAFRLRRAVLIELDRLPPQSTVKPDILVAGALAKAFPCPETLERKK